MATAKKKPTVKTTKVAPKRKTVKKQVAKAPAVRSFKRAAEPAPFLTYRVTNETAYWLILSALVLALGAWVLYLNIKVQDVYDQIEINNAAADSIVLPSTKAQ